MRPFFWRERSVFTEISKISDNKNHARLAVALVWLYQGLWRKLLFTSAAQQSIVSSAPFTLSPLFILRLIGCCETAVGIWVISGFRRGAAAVVQTVLLIAMNGGALLWAQDQIPDPAGMVFLNLAFVSLAWVLAEK